MNKEIWQDFLDEALDAGLDSESAVQEADARYQAWLEHQISIAEDYYDDC